MMPSNYLVLCRPLLLLLSIFPSIRVFSSELALHIRWPKYWRFSFSIVFPMNIQGWFPLGLIGLILLSKGFSRVFSNTITQKHRLFSDQPSLWSNSHIHDYWKNYQFSSIQLLSRVQLFVTPWTTVPQASVSIINSMHMNLSNFQETVEARGAWHAAVHGVAESDTTEQLN